MADDEDNSDKEDGVVDNLRQQIRTQYDKGMLELRLQLVRMRTEYLNNINTQSTLLASCAVAMLSSGEIQAVADMERGLWSWIFNILYVGAASFCLSCSVWVIYTSMNLINISIHSTLYGKDMAALTEADNLIELRMKEVRLMFVLSLGALFVATFSMLAEEASIVLILVGGSCFGAAAWHSSTADAGTVAIYEKYTGLKVKDRLDGVESLRDLMIPFGHPDHSSAHVYGQLRDAADPAVSAFLMSSKRRKDDPDDDGNASSWQAAREHFVGNGDWDPSTVATVIQRAVRQKLVRQQDKSEAIYIGWLLKTPAEFGPLHKQRELLQQVAAGAPSPTLADLPPSDPRFPKFFVLDEKKHTLAIFASDEERQAGEAPKFVVKNLRTQSLMRLKGDDGSTVLALLPSIALKGQLDAAEGGKSWYLRAADDAQTNMWYGRLRAAGTEWKGLDYKSGHKAPSGFRSKFAAAKPHAPHLNLGTPTKPPSRPGSYRGVATSALGSNRMVQLPSQRADKRTGLPDPGGPWGGPSA